MRKETQEDDETYINLKVAVNNGDESQDGDRISSPLSFCRTSNLVIEKEDPSNEQP